MASAIAAWPRLSLCALVGCVPPLALACAGAKPAVPPSPFPARPAGALEVRLSLDEAADLDLHVTDPRLETVYFGNTPSVGGGRLDRDVRCEVDAGPGERRETVRFDAPLAGRYRVGVDYVSACRRFRRQARYRIRVIGPGLDLERDGRLEPGRFDHKALEFDWPPASPGAAPAEPAPTPEPASAPTASAEAAAPRGR